MVDQRLTAEHHHRLIGDEAERVNHFPIDNVAHLIGHPATMRRRRGESEVSVLQRIAACVVLLLLSGCHKYLLEVTPGPLNTDLPSSNVKLSSIINPNQVYTSVYAETNAKNVTSEINGCTNDFILDLIMTKQTNITLHCCPVK